MTLEEISEIYPETIVCDGFDDAIIGIAERIGLGPVIAYDTEKIIQTLIDRDGMTHEEAQEYFDYNIIGSWVGDLTPVFITKNI